jgi:4-amino-4-deoxy-L-arabinose transferase-like glycosyltransferase
VTDRTTHLSRRLAGFAGIWAAVWAAVSVLHAPLLRLPYYWDEAGYYIPAAYDFARFGALIPQTTLSNAHPPLPSLWLALWWRVFGYHPLTTRLAVSAISALALLAVYRIARAASTSAVAVAAAGLTALYPVWFAQSILAHADIFAAAATLWGLALLVAETPAFGTACVCFCVAALCKETAVVTPLALAALFLAQAWRGRARGRLEFLHAGYMVVPAVLLTLWYAYHWRMTGFVFGNPQYLRYNATGTLHASRIAFAFSQRLWHVAGHMNLWVAGLITLAVWLLPVRTDAEPVGLNRAARGVLAVAFVTNVVAFSFLGGALLTRYLLAVFPLVLLFHVVFWERRTRHWRWAAAVTGLAFVIGWTVDPPYTFAPEDNLDYAAAIRLDQSAIAQIVQSGPRPVVLTAWPLTDYLSKPELGYVTTPVAVTPVADFTLASLFQARQEQKYSEALLFSTKDAPAKNVHMLQRWMAPTNRAYFGLHSDVPPEYAARLLGGTLTWQQSNRRLWAAVVRFDAPVDAMLAPERPRF